MAMGRSDPQSGQHLLRRSEVSLPAEHVLDSPGFDYVPKGRMHGHAFGARSLGGVFYEPGVPVHTSHVALFEEIGDTGAREDRHPDVDAVAQTEAVKRLGNDARHSEAPE